jgi:hypothetical protein
MRGREVVVKRCQEGCMENRWEGLGEVDELVKVPAETSGPSPVQGASKWCTEATCNDAPATLHSLDDARFAGRQVQVIRLFA